MSNTTSAKRGAISAYSSGAYEITPSSLILDVTKFTLVDTTADIYLDIIKQHETKLTKFWLDKVKKKALENQSQLKSNFRTLITIPDMYDNVLELKYRVGSGEELVCMHIDKHFLYVTMETAGEIFSEIKQILSLEKENRIAIELEKYTMGIYSILNGEQNARFLIRVPGKDKPFKYKIGDGTRREVVLELGRKTNAEYLRDYTETVKLHFRNHYMLYYGITMALVLVLAGYNTNDVIKVIHVFDPQVTVKLYEILSILLNRTDAETQTKE